jgi:DNA-binding LytR/AlgR family response regulator
VARLSPEVIFLDVRMPGLDGITLVQQHRELPPIVFCTAYDEFAVQAFEVNAVDYLLKPVRPERLAQAVERALQKRAGRSGAAVRATLQALAPPTSSTRVVSSARGEVRFFEAKDLTRFWANEKYTVFYADGAEQLTEEPLSELEQRLAAVGFLRIHRGELVRLDAVKVLRAEHGVHEVVFKRRPGGPGQPAPARVGTACARRPVMAQ